MTILDSFWTPAHQQDLTANPADQQLVNETWNTNLNGFSQQGITGNPWTSTYASDQTAYYNPLEADDASSAIVQQIQWSAFPGRILYYFSDLSSQDLYSLADTGYQTNGQSFPPITKDPCSGTAENLPFGPYGPRGWQDEYCEWAVTRNTESKITRIDFTCENPEYWNTLWMVSPQTVLELYQSTLAKPQIQIEDLYLYGSDGSVVIDPSTGQAAYNTLNKWNSGTVSNGDIGGAMHLTSTPNTIQTEINLAASATVQRQMGNNDAEKLICCANYGQPFRNSDPNIGQSVNKIVSLNLAATLTNPPGLYIQMPNFNNYKTPDATPASQFWNITRGQETLVDSFGKKLPGNFILHATFEVPESLGYTVSDITIDGENIKWAGQIAKTFFMEINGSGFKQTAPAAQPCVGQPAAAQPQPLQLFHSDVFWAMYNTNIPNPVQQTMNLASNSTLIAPVVHQGQQNIILVLTVAGVDTASPPTVSFEGNEDITADLISYDGHNPITNINYAVPGNTYPSDSQALILSVNIAPTAVIGLRNLIIRNPGQSAGTAMPALLNILPASS